MRGIADKEVIVRTLAMVLATLAVSAPAFASQITCTGSYMGYDVKAQTSYTNNAMAGQIAVLITEGSSVVSNLQLTATASDIRPGQYLKFAGQGDQGSGAIDATYDPSTRLYNGTLAAETGLGDATIDVNCSLQ
jgi:hypothetical protein